MSNNWNYIGKSKGIERGGITLKRNQKNQWRKYVVCLLSLSFILLGESQVHRAYAAQKVENTIEESKIANPADTVTEASTGVLSEKNQAKAKAAPINIVLDGEEYQLPFSVQKLIQNGWNWNEMTEQFVSLCSYSMFNFTKGDLEIGVRLMNPTMVDTTDLGEVLVYSIKASPNILSLQDGYSMDETWTKEMVKQYYGEPHLENGITKGAIESLTEEGEEVNLYHYDEITTGRIDYQYYAYSATDIYIDGKGTVNNIEVTSLFIDIKQALEDCYVKENYYKAPTSLGSNVMRFIFKLSGKLYRLPVPIETLMMDGWKLSEKDSASYVSSKTTREITITKGEKTLAVTISNDSEYDKKLIYCDMVTISVNENTTASVLLPGKVQLGSKLTTVQKAYSKYKSTKYTIKQVNWTKRQMYKKANQYACYEYYNFIPQINGNKYHTYADEYYTGMASLDVEGGKVVGITYGQYKTGTMGKVKIAIEEKKVTVDTKKNASLYFNYAKDYSSWSSSSGYNITFYPNGLISANYDGDEWFTGDSSLSYTIDVSKKRISVNGGDIVFSYKILSSERVIFTFPDGNKVEFVTKYVK